MGSIQYFIQWVAVYPKERPDYYEDGIVQCLVSPETNKSIFVLYNGLMFFENITGNKYLKKQVVVKILLSTRIHPINTSMINDLFTRDSIFFA